MSFAGEVSLIIDPALIAPPSLLETIKRPGSSCRRTADQRMSGPWRKTWTNRSKTNKQRLLSHSEPFDLQRRHVQGHPVTATAWTAFNPPPSGNLRAQTSDNPASFQKEIYLSSLERLNILFFFFSPLMLPPQNS